MLFSRWWQAVLQYGAAESRPTPGVELGPSELTASSIVVSKHWQVLGPWQIGTREASWGADPLEYFGGFRALEYDSHATFKSSLARNGTIVWTETTAEPYDLQSGRAGTLLTVDFPSIDWEGLRNIYGWAALQWQAWLRGRFFVNHHGPLSLVIYSPQILEFWVDEKHFFGGDFYGYNRAPVVLDLQPGVHRLDVRLVRDVRAMGGVGIPKLEMNITFQAQAGSIQSHERFIPLLLLEDRGYQSGALVSDFIGGDNDAHLASPLGSIILRNHYARDTYVHTISETSGACSAELVSDVPVKFVSGQSRPLAFRLTCAAGFYASRSISYQYQVDGASEMLNGSFFANFQLRRLHEPQKVTFLHIAGIVSYAILRPPSTKAIESRRRNTNLPILLGLHGAGVEAENEIVAHSLDPLPNLPAWTLFPTGGTPWSGDDWHAWGFADVEGAIHMITDWIEEVGWTGPGVDTDRWLVSGHSNGGQGTWYTLTHHPDKVIAAAPVSGYSSIQNYVPYTLWSVADPGRTAVVQSALNSYKNELLLANVKGIPILQQHGGADDNVPPYHSRLMSQMIQEVGAVSDYFEFSGQPHFWDGVMTTNPLREFYERQIVSSNDAQPLALDSFSVVSSNPGDTSPKHGLEILQLIIPGQLGRIDVTFDAMTSACTLKIHNIQQFYMPPAFRECNFIRINEHIISSPSDINAIAGSTWNADGGFHEPNWPRPFPPRRTRQLGAMDAILRTKGPFVINRLSENTEHIALQISRNLCQYFSADTHITDDSEEAFNAQGNVVSVIVGDDVPPGYFEYFPITIQQSQVHVRRWDGRTESYEATPGQGLAAIFLRPLPLGRLELVVWGVDAASLSTAARLVPMMPGVGQPDFVIADRTMLWKGLEGVHALGFLDSRWNVSKNSFFTQ